MESKNILDSWKEVASYLKKSEKTCRRREKKDGLPVHRLEGSPKAHIFAYKDELDRWVEEKINTIAILSEKTLVWRLKRIIRIILPVSAAVALIIVLIALWKIQFPKRPSEHSIAVLPFVDISPANKYQYLGDGIATTLIKQLSLLEGWRISPRTSSFFFRGETKGLSEIGRELKVRAVLEGSLQVEGNMLRVSANLVNVEDGSYLWSETYDRKFENIFSIEDDVAASIVKALKGRTADRDVKLFVNRDRSNAQAYNFYLKGIELLDKRGKAFLEGAIFYFNKALDFDSSYALAYSGLADAYFILAGNTHWPPDKAFPEAKKAAAMAFKLAPDLAEVRTSIALIKQHCEWDFKGASREYRRALEISPNYTAARQYYSFLLAEMGLHDESLEQIKIAQELDPLSVRILITEALDYYFARRYEEALTVLEKVADISPSDLVGSWLSGYVYSGMGNYEQALHHFEKALEFQSPKRELNLQALIAFSKAKMGGFSEARKMLDEILESGKEYYICPVLIAIDYGSLGEMDKAFKWLDVAFSQRHPQLLWLRECPIFDQLRPDLRFSDLQRRIWTE